MPTVPLHTTVARSTTGDSRDSNKSTGLEANCMPTLLETPSGLAILELQATVHAPFSEQWQGHSDNNDEQHTAQLQTPVGRLEFVDYDPTADAADTKWMKKVYLYVGKHQRLTGEVKKLPNPLVVIGKRDQKNRSPVDVGYAEPPAEELEILELVKYKILFAARPEPVGN